MLRRELDGQLAGLPTILKNMKGKKMVDYRDNFIKCVDAPRSHTRLPRLTLTSHCVFPALRSAS